MAKQERIDEESLHGGAYTVMYFLDQEGEPIDKRDAVRFEIIEYRNDDTAIWRTYGEMKPQQ